jgi:tetratricopeptide (TPR) repeat protein
VHIALAESHAALDELDTAVYYARQAVRLDGENRSYTILLAELLHRSQKEDESLALLDAWVAGHPDDLDAHYQFADLLAELGRQEDALAVYENLVGRQVDEMQIRYRMLQLYNGLGDLDGMRRSVRRMLVIDPTNSSLRHLLSEVYIELDSTAAAIGVLEEAVADDPTDVSTTLLLSKLYREEGRDREAEILIRATTDSRTGDSQDKLTLASDLYARSASDVLAAQRAEQLLGEMLEAGMETPEVLYMLGDLRYRSAEYLKAAPLLARAAEREPRRMDAWTKAALAYLKGGNWTQALEIAQEALILFPGNYPLLRVAGQSSLRIGRPEEAIDYSEAALDVVEGGGETSTSEVIEMLLLQATAYRLLGLPEAAEQALRTLLQRSSLHPEGNYWLVMSLLDQDGRLVEARRLAESHLERAPGNARFLDAMGWVEHEAGNDETALKFLKKAHTAAGSDVLILEHLGDVYSSLGDQEMAISYWQEALERDPHSVALRAKIEQHR